MSTDENVATDFILVADDEADIHAVTKLSLKGLKRPNRRVEILSASSGKEAVEALRKNPNIAVVLLDVVMENDHAGLDACRTIRGELGNRLVRILLRTGQPGAAPERQTIDDYDIDGYLPKAEVTSGKLYSAVRTALRAHTDLVELDRHRKLLGAINDCVVGLRSFAPLTDTLKRVLDTVVAICPAPLAALQLETFEQHGEMRRYFLHIGPAGELRAEDVRSRVLRAGAAGKLREPSTFEDGFVVPLEVHRELGHGWIYVAEPAPDAVVKNALPILAAHAANALYSSVAESILRAEQSPIFDTMDV
jgi:CheY-like chemotaxis protein